jgi:CyaY protein
MDEKEFNRLADAMLKRIEDALDAQALDLEVKPGGVIEVEFDDGSKIIINRHTAAREIWVAARLGGFHFRHDNGRWLGTRDGTELMEALGRLVSGQAGRSIAL